MRAVDESIEATERHLEQGRLRAQAVADAYAAALASLRSALKAERVAIPIPQFVKDAVETLPDSRLSPTATMKDAATFVMARAQGPVRIRQIYDTARAAGWGYAKDYDTFRGSINPMLTRDKTFKRVGPGLYEISR